MRENLINIYEDVLNGKRKIFPHGTWKPDNGGFDNFKRCLRYVVLEKLHWGRKTALENIVIEFFTKYKLNGAINLLFNKNIYKAVTLSFPEWEINVWELKFTSRSYWSKDTGIKAVKWMIEEKLNWTIDKVKEELNTKTFKDYGLYGMLQYSFNSSPFKAIQTTYPNKIKEWEFKNMPLGRNYWTIDKGKESVKWLIEEKLKWNDNQVKDNISKKVFHENGLGSMLQILFDDSPHKAINETYPQKYSVNKLKSYSYNLHKEKVKQYI